MRACKALVPPLSISSSAVEEMGKGVVVVLKVVVRFRSLNNSSELIWGDGGAEESS